MSRGLNEERLVKLLFYAMLSLVICVNTLNLNQPILEAQAFRQTQTALTAFYLQKNGFTFQYQTPVIGMGWSIPFEFPIYQELVALVSGLGIKLTVAGRLVSLAFGVLTCIPLYKSLRRLGMSETPSYYATTLYLSSPVYIFWSGSFMIETAATFFAIAFLYFFLVVLQRDWSVKNFLFTALFLLCALLQKITTVFPVLMLAMLVLAFYAIKYFDINKIRKKVVYAFFSIGVPLLLAYVWVRYTDQVKLSNPIGEALTSSALSRWNYGTWEQRFSEHLWRGVIYERVIKTSSFHFLGMLSIAWAMFFCKAKVAKMVVAFSVILFFLPFFIFTNLHAVHDYYQVSNTLYLSVAVGISVYCMCCRLLVKHKIVSVIVLLSFIGSNLYFSYQTYAQSRFVKILEENNRTLELSSYLRYNTDEGKPIVVYGYDWSSEIAFYSERKALTLPWGRWDLEAVDNPFKFLRNEFPSVYVLCPNNNFESIKSEIKSKYNAQKIVKIADCEIFHI